MTLNRSPEHAQTFQSLRPQLIALAYRMLGDLARAEDVMQEAWLRWQHAPDVVASPKSYLSKVVARLCLNELGSAHARREESRGDRLPEPIDLAAHGGELLEQYERVSMAFLVLLQRLTPPERAVFLLHEVFDFEHAQIAELVGRSEPTCRKLLERARQAVAVGKKTLRTSRDEHQRMLRAFVTAATAGDLQGLLGLLAEDAELISDGGASGRDFAGVRNPKLPLRGARAVAAFVARTSARAVGVLQLQEQELNGQPALVFWRDGEPFAALLLAVADEKIQRVFFHADPDRLRHLGSRAS
jgi:RNA polymerase sigma-70 factor (ECF subfamily)